LRLLLAAAAVLAFVLALAAAPAEARVTGPCQILIQETDAALEGATVEVPQGGNVTYRITSGVPVLRWSVDLHYGPLTLPVFDQSYDASLGALERSGAFSMAAFTRYGTGIYEVSGQAELQDGSRCDVSLRMRVEGSPFRSVIGLAAVALIGVGGVGLLAILLQAVLDANDVREAVVDFLDESREAKAAAALVAPSVPVSDALAASAGDEEGDTAPPPAEGKPRLADGEE